MKKYDHDWLTSVEVRKSLRISTCDLAHLRADGAIRSEKRGSAFFYASRDVEALRKRRLTASPISCALD